MTITEGDNINFYQGTKAKLISNLSSMNDSDLAVATDEMQWYMKQDGVLAALDRSPVGTDEIENGAVTNAKLAQSITDSIDMMADVSFIVSQAVLNKRVASRALSRTGALVYDADRSLYFYNVYGLDAVILSLANNDAITANTVYEFSTSINTSDAIASTITSGDVSGIVSVPADAQFLIVSQITDSTFSVRAAAGVANVYGPDLDLLSSAYQTIKGNFRVGNIMDGVPAVSSQRVSHTAPVSYDRNVTLHVKDGFTAYAFFYRDASGSQASYRGFRSITAARPISVASGVYFMVTVYKEQSENVVDAYEYISALTVTTGITNRMNRKTLLREVSHQGYSANIPNTYGYDMAEGYTNAAIAGFTHGETDIAFSSDGVPMCSHDPSFTDMTTGDTIVIAEHTAAELKEYTYHGGVISTFDEVMKACKDSGIGLYIDHVDVTWTDAQWESVFRVVRKYSMQDDVFWISSVNLPKVVQWYADSNFCVLVNNTSGLASAKTLAASLKTSRNTVSIDLNYSNFPIETLITTLEDMPPGIEVEAWTIDTAQEWKAYAPYLKGITSNFICSALMD